LCNVTDLKFELLEFIKVDELCKGARITRQEKRDSHVPPLETEKHVKKLLFI
jgi:hypothetical protein